MKKISLLIFALFCLCIGKDFAQIRDLVTFTTGWPYGSLTLTNKLYGMTSESGIYSKGVIFSIDTNGVGYKTLHNFNDTDGAGPGGCLTLVGSKFYGMTNTGGLIGPHGEGIIFSMDTDGNNYKVIHTFCCTGGYNPEGDLMLIGSKFYGMAGNGGAYTTAGVIFSMDSDGSNYKVILSFDDTDGAEPQGDLTLIGNKFYGMTEEGGVPNYKGNIFSIDTDGTHFKNLFTFNDTNGGWPFGNLTLLGNKFFGMTSYGGAHQDGVIFSIDTTGNNYKILFTFNGTAGESPTGTLTLSNGVFYGMTRGGGKYNYGVIFSIDTDGTNYNVLFSFNEADGGGAYGNLTITGNIFYGLTYYGPDAYHGLAFKFYDTVLYLTAYGRIAGCTLGNNGYATVTVGGGIGPYTYLWAPGGGTSATVSGLSAGTYTLTVNDSYGYVASTSVTISQPNPIVIVPDSVADNGSCNGAAWVSVSGGVNPYTYFWTGGNTTDSIGNQCHGYYCCLVTDADGCPDSVCINIPLVITTGTNEVKGESEKVTVYPNPNNGVFTIEWSVVSSQWSVEIYDVLGQKVYSQFSTFNPQLSLDLSSQPNGIYFYRVLNNEGSALGEGKIIIQK